MGSSAQTAQSAAVVPFGWPMLGRYLAAAIFAVTLSACGSDDAEVVANAGDENTTVTGEQNQGGSEQGGDDHSGEEHEGEEHEGEEHEGEEHEGEEHAEGEHGEYHIETLGRLAVQESGAAQVRFVELDSGQVASSIATTNPVSALQASPDRRYAVAIQRNQNLVEFIDGGLWQEDHGDHLHDYRTDPAAVDFSLTGVRPTHFESHDELAAVFNDGLADGNTPASVTVLSDVSIGTSRIEASLDLPAQMHGTAKPLGRFLLTTWRAPDNVNTLPERVELYEYQNGAYQFVNRFDETCPDMHGSYANETHTVFGCSDGVLVVARSGDTFSASRIVNPPDTPADVRIGTVTGHHERATFLGYARPNYLYEIDPAAGEIRPITWPGQQRVAWAVADEGNTFAVMDESGTVHLLDGTANWAIKASVPAASGVPEDGSSPAIEPHGNEPVLYVSDPAGQRIVAINSANGTVAQTMSLDFAPGQIR